MKISDQDPTSCSTLSDLDPQYLKKDLTSLFDCLLKELRVGNNNVIDWCF